jgi:hypothetical protein
MIRLIPSQITVDAAAVEGLPSRSISGVAVTYDETATVLTAQKYDLNKAHCRLQVVTRNFICSTTATRLLAK